MTTLAPSSNAANAAAAAVPLGNLSFIETQFPVSKMSIESFRERTAKQAQTLTGLGKWWGRKPLVLCRATILGLLLPATHDPSADRKVFLRLMTMDEEGLLRRKTKRLPAPLVYERSTPTTRQRHFIACTNRKGERSVSYRLSATTTIQKQLFKQLNGRSPRDKDVIDPNAIYGGLGDADRRTWFTNESSEARAEFYVCPQSALDEAAFASLPYNEKMEYVCRPEQVDGPSPESWTVINAHLGTTAKSIPELVAELGKRRFGRVPRVGDSFCGGGSIPFEAARIGCDAYGSDLNPVAALLTWASLNIVGGGPKVAEQVQEAQREVFDAVDKQITAWGVEHNEDGHRADAYLYCTEVTCPECGWRVPLVPSWVIGRGSLTIARLIPDEKRKRFDFEIRQGVSAKELSDAGGTVADSTLICPNCRKDGSNKPGTPIRSIRGDGRGTFGDSKSLLRGWENDDLIPRDTDIFSERLYCIRWVDPKTGTRTYAVPTDSDLKREVQVLELLRERFVEWQKRGYIPSRRIEPGQKTDEPIRTRGWMYWHHLFTPRQLLVNGLFVERSLTTTFDNAVKMALLLGCGRVADWNARLCRWDSSPANEKGTQTYSNQALNTLANYCTRALQALDTTWFARINSSRVIGKAVIDHVDARSITNAQDIWITDPPYADAVNYEEITEFFLVWYTSGIKSLFPAWGTDSRRAMAVKGNDDAFARATVECYKRLAEKMPANGYQIVMFTHQDAGVWADLANILWAAGLCVCSAWCIATEIEATGIKEGNYVQGTVILVLRKQGSEETAFLDEVYVEVEGEVRRQLDAMKDLDDANDPNFADTDYQLAAYAAALRILTSKKIEEIDVAYELSRTRAKGEKSEVEKIIEQAVKIACDHLVPRGIETHLWKTLGSMERFYLKGIEFESHGERRSGVYQELARGFGISEYRNLLASTKANETRLRTAGEFKAREMGESGFGASLIRHALFAAWKASETESTRDAITWLKTEVKDYAASRGRLIEILEFFATLEKNSSMQHWHKDAHAASLVAGALRNREDHV